jgi:hypothetical protein
MPERSSFPSVDEKEGIGFALFSTEKSSTFAFFFERFSLDNQLYASSILPDSDCFPVLYSKQGTGVFAG